MAVYVMTKQAPPTRGKHAEKRMVMMSELHLELDELLEAGINIWDIEEALHVATQWGFPLVAGAISHDQDGYLAFVDCWFAEATR